jgi:CheY-like chemotaxis protein
MPRLLLVDDNPSIHRIAESLLAPTDLELVCVASAAEALDRIGRGDRFDVALVDTAMPGMDGWTLLDRLRGMEETVRMPIALMAGVLDPVDPARLAKAPIQGFLKKPIELRELGDRVKALLATPVVVSPSALSTAPAMPVKDLLKHAEAALPELRPEPAELSAELLDIEDLDLDLPEPEDDLLVLTAEDLWPEDPLLSSPGLEELETVPTDFIDPFVSPVPEPAVDSDASLAAADEQGTVLPAPDASAAGQVPVSPEQARALLQALLAEPVLMDVLVKALVERLGDQVLREIAWEVMPDLAGRLQR